MIYKYSKVITYKDIVSITQEYNEFLKVRTLIIETIDECKLTFHKYENLKPEYCMYEHYLQENLEYDEMNKVVGQYMQYSELINKSLLMLFKARKIVECEE